MSANITNISRVVPPPPHGYINEIAKILGCHRVTVSNAIKKNSRGILAEQARQIYKTKYEMDNAVIEELIIAKKHAEECDRLKTTFLTNMSHKIRTPMNGILVFIELMKQAKLTGEEQQKYINVIVKSGTRLLNNINDVISISKIEWGQMKIHKDTQEIVVGNLKILIVDDDKISVMLIKEAIKIFCKDVLKARNGLEAIEIFHNNPDIDLVFMDIKMPGMNGYEATRQIRQFNTDVVIIAQTACALNGDREKTIEAGCNDYISKPLNLALLRAIIEKYFRFRLAKIYT